MCWGSGGHADQPLVYVRASDVTGSQSELESGGRAGSAVHPSRCVQEAGWGQGTGGWGETEHITTISIIFTTTTTTTIITVTITVTITITGPAGQAPAWAGRASSELE